MVNDVVTVGQQGTSFPDLDTRVSPSSTAASSSEAVTAVMAGSLGFTVFICLTILLGVALRVRKVTRKHYADTECSSAEQSFKYLPGPQENYQNSFVCSEVSTKPQPSDVAFPIDDAGFPILAVALSRRQSHVARRLSSGLSYMYDDAGLPILAVAVGRRASQDQECKKPEVPCWYDECGLPILAVASIREEEVNTDKCRVHETVYDRFNQVLDSKEKRENMFEREKCIESNLSHRLCRKLQSQKCTKLSEKEILPAISSQLSMTSSERQIQCEIFQATSYTAQGLSTGVGIDDSVFSDQCTDITEIMHSLLSSVSLLLSESPSSEIPLSVSELSSDDEYDC